MDRDMVINQDAATLKLLRDYQENGQRIGGLANLVHSKVTAIRKLLDLLESADPGQVVAVDDGFRVPPGWTVDPGNTDHVPLGDVSIEEVHEALRELSMAKEDATRLEGCLKTAGFSGFIRTE